MKNKALALTCLLLMFAVPGLALAQDTLQGIPKVNEWTDFENQSNEMPADVWGTCDADRANRVGIRVLFQDGTFGEATYRHTANLWNIEKFIPIEYDSADGFLANCQGLHYLFNDGVTLPMAWEECQMAYSDNFDLDYDEDNGSQFRADVGGWVQATFQTYCGGVFAVPTLSPWGLVILVLIVLGAVIVVMRRRRAAA